MTITRILIEKNDFLFLIVLLDTHCLYTLKKSPPDTSIINILARICYMSYQNCFRVKQILNALN